MTIITFASAFWFLWGLFGITIFILWIADKLGRHDDLEETWQLIKGDEWTR